MHMVHVTLDRLYTFTKRNLSKSDTSESTYGNKAVRSEGASKLSDSQPFLNGQKVVLFM